MIQKKSLTDVWRMDSCYHLYNNYKRSGDRRLVSLVSFSFNRQWNIIIKLISEDLPAITNDFLFHFLSRDYISINSNSSYQLVINVCAWRLHPSKGNVGSFETRGVNSEFDSRVSVRPSNQWINIIILINKMLNIK